MSDIVQIDRKLVDDPTPEMIEAGHDAAMKLLSGDEAGLGDYAGYDDEQLKAAFRAMIEKAAG
jgi:hypothetical protein